MKTSLPACALQPEATPPTSPQSHNEESIQLGDQGLAHMQTAPPPAPPNAAVRTSSLLLIQTLVSRACHQLEEAALAVADPCPEEEASRPD
jgi:hypothetical protein